MTVSRSQDQTKLTQVAGLFLVPFFLYHGPWLSQPFVPSSRQCQCPSPEVHFISTRRSCGQQHSACLGPPPPPRTFLLPFLFYLFSSHGPAVPPYLTGCLILAGRFIFIFLIVSNQRMALFCIAYLKQKHSHNTCRGNSFPGLCRELKEKVSCKLPSSKITFFEAT